MATLDRDGVSIYFEVHGEGPTVLLTHGFSATSHMWKPQLEAMSPDYRLVIWDMRGHGRSDSPPDPAAYSEALTVQDMVALCDALDAEQVVAAGLSLGGYMSLAFHLTHPKRVAGLMLFDTGPGYKKDEPRAAWNRAAEKRAQAFESRGLDALPSRGEIRPSAHRSAQGLANASRGLLAQADARVIESLPHISVPTLVLAGSEDKPFLAATDYMAAKVPGARKVLLQGAGHASNIDKPEEFNREVLAFLREIRW